MNLVQLGDNEPSRPGDLSLNGTFVAGIKGGDGHRTVVDKRGFESDGATRGAIPMRAKPRSTTTASRRDAFGDNQVHGYQSVGPLDVCLCNPYAGVDVASILCREMETGACHRGFKLRVVAEKAGVEREVGVGGVWRDAQVGGTGSKVDRLRAGHDDRAAVR